MNTINEGERGHLEFEEIPARADIQVSKVIHTSDGDKIRAIVTTGQSVVLAAVGHNNGDTVVVTGGSTSLNKISLGDIWGWAHELAQKVKSVLSDGGSSGCTTTTNTTVNVGNDGKITSVQVTSQSSCSPS